jgi:hypothetical protein
VTHIVKDISDVLGGIDTTDSSSDMREPSARRGDFESEVEDPYNRWRTKLGSKAYMMHYWRGAGWPARASETTAAFRAALGTPSFKAQSPIAHLLRCYYKGHHKNGPVASIVGGRRLALVEKCIPYYRNPGQVFALVPATACVDDKVCFIRSCPVPFLLWGMPPVAITDVAGPNTLNILDSKVHALEQNGTVPPDCKRFWSGDFKDPVQHKKWVVEHFRLIGECFVQGLMYGYASDVPNHNGWKASLIVLQ